MTEQHEKPKRKMTKKDVRTLFQERMKREGRSQEWHQNVRAIQKETGKKYGQVIYAVMEKMGYEGPETERALQAEFEKSILQAALVADQDDFDKAVQALPSSASGEAEMGWIVAHPIMLKRARQISDEQTLLLNSKDVEGAPSRSAVTLLQWYLRSPTKMFEQLMSELKKKIGSGESASKGASKDEDLVEVRRLLEEVKR